MGEQLGMSRQKFFGIALKYGMSATALLLVGFAIAFFIFENAVQSFRQLSIVLIILFMFFAVKEYRSNQRERLLFWQGAVTAIMTFILFALFSTISLAIFLEYIHPDSFAYYIDFKLESLERYQEMMDAEEFARYSTNTKTQTPGGIAMEHLFGLSFVGVFGSLFIAAILRKAPGYKSENKKRFFT